MIRYLFAYTYQNPTGDFGVVTCELPMDRPIRSLADTREVQDWIQANTDLGVITVISFSRFDDDPAGGQTR